ncbi:thiamine phosphate synthase [Photobacterium sanctipauli]|uniref:Thiamine-phosphate synthase n=1 Tax=Photobacterium sanctipauli TaxID=1342794 RepID=A0A2T3NSY7_9GAMM|nr:thiamine phosphate synthase [Photobacterium sanctipauli]PSW19390.1 thiamine phosphate synthase [Photobacterium sanctipauli]
MSTLCLPEQQTPLLTHIEPLLAAAENYQLGEAVELGASRSAVVDIVIEGQAISLAFGDTKLEGTGYQVRDLWVAPYPSLAEMQQQVANQPQLVVLGLPTATGFADIWHHNGEARANHCHQMGDREPAQAMLLASLALDYPLEDAVTLARAYARSVVYQDGLLAWPLERQCFPRPLTANHSEAEVLGWSSKEVAVKPFAKTDPAKLKLYPVVDTAEWVEKVLELGVKTTQLRIKDPSEPTLPQQVERIIAAGREHQAQVFVNDYWQLAIASQAYGVHLGQEDLETADLAAIQQAGLCLGLSTHGYYEILRAAEFAPSYIALGHIYPTTTKQMPSKPQGLSRLALYQQLIGDMFPTVAIGGIDLSRAESVWQTGVSSVAVVRAVTQAEDPQAAVDAFNRILVRPTEQ